MWDYDKEPDFLDVEDDDFDSEEDDEEEEEEENDVHDDDDEEDEYVRVNFTIPKNMRKKVKKFAKDVNLSVSELIRGSLDGIMSLSEVGVDLGKQIEFGLKEGLKGLEESLKEIDFEKFKELEHLDFDLDLKDEE
ncbi:MAG: hypothetical protein ACTSRD_10025 [Promethearchaeota archaeon]